MARLRRATYSLMVSLLPATATVIGIVVLAQIPRSVEVVGVALVVAAVATHRDRSEEGRRERGRRPGAAGAPTQAARRGSGQLVVWLGEGPSPPSGRVGDALSRRRVSSDDVLVLCNEEQRTIAEALAM